MENMDAETTTKLNKMTLIQFLHALSYSMSVSPSLIFCDIDLTTMHIDMDIEDELSRCMHAAGHPSATLMQVEQFVYTLGHSSSGPSSAEKVITQNFATFMQNIPPWTAEDTTIVKGSTLTQPNSTPTALDFGQHYRLCVRFCSQLPPHATITTLESAGPIFRALSMPPPKESDSPLPSPKMTLESELSPPLMAAPIPSPLLSPVVNAKRVGSQIEQ
ncbi:hypothetical protein B0H14DRAFT_2561830 [Mycena olivaceomarginata]|nr:hypothetical protein B0H14DRAFT_2561830 [Mycena olivaceomarginata]